MKELFKAEEQISEEILHRCKSGDTMAFREIVKKYQKYAFILTFKILLNEDDAKDVVQETFIRIWKHISVYNSQIKFTTWIYKIVTNLCYDKLRSDKRKEKIMDNKLEVENLLVAVKDSNELIMENKQLAGIIENLAEELSQKQRMVFILRDLQDLSIKEVSSILDMPKSSVKTNLIFARKNIKEKLEKYL
ncbi:MAG: RNA polymerase sigma factor [Ignavibacteriales bacterium]|nr:RNA polymerase sigma factor [Ignavibacteriales bacterium]